MTKRILHIEDDGNTQDLVRVLLEPQGYAVIAASTGAEGLEKLRGGDIDLVLLDVMLPDMSGWEVLTRMRETFCQSRVAFMSVVDISNDELDDLRTDGISDYILKPFENEDLVRRVRNILEPQRTILHIEDDDDTRELVKMLLEARGYRVLTASRGEEGLSRVRADIDLVLLDVMLPDMCGWTIFQKIRRNSAHRNLKVAFLSIMPISDDQFRRFQEIGVSDYIMKPFDNTDLVKRVDNVMGSDLL